MVKTICLRGTTLARFAMVLVLLSVGNTPALRVITLREGKNASTLGVTLRASPCDKQQLYGSLFELYPAIDKRTVNRQPGFRAGDS